MDEKLIADAEKNYEKKVAKSNTGNIIIKFKNSTTVLKRVCDIESVVNKLREIFKDKIEIKKGEDQ